MTADEKRERLLKRLLPGLVIAVVYFVFISPWVNAGLNKAKTDRQAFYTRGVMPEALSALSKQKQQLDGEISKLTEKKAEFGKQLNAYAGFLFDPAYVGHLNDRVSALLSENRLREVGSETLSDKENKEVARSVQDVFQRLGEVPGKKLHMTIWRINFTGFYPDVYRFMTALQTEKPAIIPVALVMRPATDDRMGMYWSLSFWVAARD